LGQAALVVKAASEREFDAAFATLVQAGAGALLGRTSMLMPLCSSITSSPRRFF
jgi:hypothetical protein